MIVQSTRVRREGGVQYRARHLLGKMIENERIVVLVADRQTLEDAHALTSAMGG